MDFQQIRIMSRPGHYSLLLAACFALMTAPLLAQRYQEHDHTVFHRPAPPPKHQVATAAVNHPSAAVPGATAHASDPARRHDATLGTPPAAVEPHVPQAGK